MSFNKAIPQAKQDSIQELKKEVDKTLMFFLKTDIEIYGKISDSTVQAFQAQEVEIPERFQTYIK